MGQEAELSGGKHVLLAPLRSSCKEKAHCVLCSGPVVLALLPILPSFAHEVLLVMFPRLISICR